MVKKSTAKNSETKVSTSKEHLIEAFLKLAHENGAAAITIQLIADEAEVSFGTVRYHFNSEEVSIETEALKLLIQKCYVYLEEKMYIDRSHADFNPLNSYLLHMLTWVREFPTYASFLVHYYYLCTTEIKLPISNEAFIKRAHLRIESLLNEGVGLGLYPPFGNKALLSSLVHEALLGASLILATELKNGTKIDLEKHIIKIKTHADLLIQGFSPKHKDPTAKD